ncbi:unnamed protein product [Lactuca saligna]|uniref:Uncharacterized protein n=1 Tax=Lactuca saligna TaxID=75948 RepID=A0AA35YTU4_LACSI|nr:unnamed protein product [Lactuca saligna]
MAFFAIHGSARLLKIRWRKGSQELSEQGSSCQTSEVMESGMLFPLNQLWNAVADWLRNQQQHKLNQLWNAVADWLRKIVKIHPKVQIHSVVNDVLTVD